MYQFVSLQPGYLCENSLQSNVATDEGESWNETWTLNKEMKLENLCKVVSESDLNSWPNSSVVRGSERNSVVVASNPTQGNLL